jgi:O-methyltransferase
MSPAPSAGEAGTLDEFAPEKRFALLRKLIPASLHPMLRGMRKRWQRRGQKLDEPYYSAFAYTQMSPSRQQNLVRLCEILDREGIPGSIVECGVLDGGGSAIMAYATRASARPVHMFDSWEGLPVATAEDGAVAQKWAGEDVGSPARVTEVMQALKIEPSRLHVHRGWFHETFPHVAGTVESLAMLHVDCDFYEPVLLTLETWFPKLSPGGFVQIDDYDSFSGCRKGTDKFLASHPEIKIETWGSGGHAIFFRKPLIS